VAIRNIVTIPDEILRKRAKEITEFDSRLWGLLDDMTDTMRKADGIGLAAPQVGILKRAVVIDTGESGLKEFINPVILKSTGSESLHEGCLSIPGERGAVERPKSLKLEAQDRHGNKFILKAEGLLARAICHEIDHLDGILFIDKL